MEIIARRGVGFARGAPGKRRSTNSGKVSYCHLYVKNCRPAHAHGNYGHKYCVIRLEVHHAARSRRHPARSLMKLSARNKLKGKILDVKKGATTAHVRLEIAPGQIMTASITNEAVEELGLKAGGTAIAIVKASDVMIAVD
jgi:molybdopterin-binding protein